jgi:hypothetical protein
VGSARRWKCRGGTRGKLSLNLADPEVDRLSAAIQQLVRTIGHKAAAEKDVSETDRFGRLLRHVWLRDAAWLLVDLELVRDGYGWVSTYPPDVKYADVYRAGQVDAREHARGLWGDGPIDFLEPADGAIVTTKTVVVEGTAAPGVRIVRDISGGLDQSTQTASDGRWSLEVKLKSGLNTLRFRVEDEKAPLLENRLRPVTSLSVCRGTAEMEAAPPSGWSPACA